MGRGVFLRAHAAPNGIQDVLFLLIPARKMQEQAPDAAPVSLLGDGFFLKLSRYLLPNERISGDRHVHLDVSRPRRLAAFFQSVAPRSIHTERPLPVYLSQLTLPDFAS